MSKKIIIILGGHISTSFENNKLLFSNKLNYMN